MTFASETARTARSRRVCSVLVPVFGLAYPILIQPLLTFRLKDLSAGLDMSVNLRAADSNPTNQIFWLLLFLSGLTLSFHRLGSIAHAASRPVTLFIFLFLLLALASIAWSDVPDIALRRLGLQIIVVLCAVFGTYLAEDRQAVARGTALLLAAVALLNLPIVFLQPPGRLGGALGIYTDKNILGLVMGLAVAFSVYALWATRHPTRWLIHAAGLIAASTALLKSDAVTSIALMPICMVLATAVLWLSRMLRLSTGSVLLIALLWLACLLTVYAAFGGRADSLLTLAFGDPTFSGRTEIWHFVVQMIAQRPLQGVGYASFWGIGQDSMVIESAPGFIVGLLQAHNGYLDILLQGGAIGLVLLFAVIVTALRLIDRRDAIGSEKLRWLLLTLILFCVLHNAMESSWFRAFSPVWYIFLMAIGLALPRRPPAYPKR